MWSFKEGYSWCWGWICSFFGGMCQPSLKWWNMFTRKWIEWRGGGFLGHFRPCEKDEALRSNFGSCLFLNFPMAFASWRFCFGFTWIHWLPDWYIYLNGSSFSSFGREMLWEWHCYHPAGSFENNAMKKWCCKLYLKLIQG